LVINGGFYGGLVLRVGNVEAGLPGSTQEMEGQGPGTLVGGQPGLEAVTICDKIARLFEPVVRQAGTNPPTAT
jgi:hypothetical protein